MMFAQAIRNACRKRGAHPAAAASTRAGAHAPGPGPAAMTLARPRSFRLVRYFTVTSLIAFVGVAAVLGYAYRKFAIDGLLDVQESANVNLTRVFSNTLWANDFGPFLKAVQGQSAAALKASPRIPELHAKALALMKGSTAFKVKVYDMSGMTVYSTELAQVGEDKGGNAGVVAGRRGTTRSELVHKDKFSALEGEVQSRDLIQSYIPQRDPASGSIVGVFEVYSDVTPFLQEIGNTQWYLTGAVIGVLALLYAALYLLVDFAQRIITRQNQERVQVHQQLAQSEKMAALGQMVAGVAHQLNTPLAFSQNNVSLVIEQLKSIDTPVRVASKFSDIVRKAGGDRVTLNVARARGHLEAIEAAPENVGTMREMLHDVLKGIDQMRELVVHMRDFTRLDRSNVDEFDINSGLRAVVYIAKSVIPDRIRVIEDYGAVPEIMCNPSQLNQAFLNLITNAAQAIEGAGAITVRTLVEGDCIQVEIADTGSGIRADVLPHIFDTYFTTKPPGEGTGLGLPIALDMVRGHGGKISAASEVGVGTTFTVALPVRAECSLPKAA